MAAQGPTATLLLSCPDQKGLVAEVAGFIHGHGGNIVHADQHTDSEQRVFLQRVEWELDGFDLSRDGIEREFTALARRFGMSWSLHFSDYLPRIGVMVSKQAHCLYDLFARVRMGELRAELPIVVSNHPDLEGAARSFGTEFVHLPVTVETKAAQEAEAFDRFEAAGADLIVLARYMQVLTPAAIERYRNRIINIHHSFLPAFAGARPYHQAFRRGVKIIGATAHYATEDLDQGPIIEQDVVRSSHRDSVADLVRKGADLEKVVLARAVDLHVRNRVLTYGRKTAVFA